MSRELKIVYHNSGSPVLYGCLRQPGTGHVWYPAGATFEAWGTGSRTASDYDLTVTHRGGSVWTADMPTGMVAGLYDFVVYLQSGASPADGDVPVSSDRGRWTGSEWQGAIGFVAGVP